MDNIKAVIFDLDGVLIDSEVCYISKLWHFVKEEFGKSVPKEALLPIVGASGMAHFLAVKDYLPPDWGREEYLVGYRAYLARNPISYPELCFPDVPATLAWLKGKGYRMALATSSPRDKVEQSIGECGLTDYFAAMLTRDDVENCKPDPEIYQKALRKLDLPPEQCLVVEDSSIGIAAAKAAGIAVAARRENRYPMDQSQADYFLEQIGDLPNLLTSA